MLRYFSGWIMKFKKSAILLIFIFNYLVFHHKGYKNQSCKAKKEIFRFPLTVTASLMLKFQIDVLNNSNFCIFINLKTESALNIGSDDMKWFLILWKPANYKVWSKLKLLLLLFRNWMSNLLEKFKIKLYFNLKMVCPKCQKVI